MAALSCLSNSKQGNVEAKVDLDQLNADRLELTTSSPVAEFLVIDAAVPDKHLFYSELKPGQKIVEIDADADGLKQLTAVLKKHQGLGALHIISHAEPGSVQLGNTYIDEDTLK